jgi:hypothetical protein
MIISYQRLIMNNNLKFLVDFHANLKIKQIRKNAFRDEKFEREILKAKLEKLINDWVDFNIPVDKIDFEKLKEINIENIINDSLTKQALKKQILLIKKLAETEKWYEGEQSRSPIGDVFLNTEKNTYKQIGYAISLLMMSTTFFGAPEINPMVTELVSKLQELDPTLTVAAWSTPTILGLIIDALKRKK